MKIVRVVSIVAVSGCAMGAKQTSLLARGEAQGATHSVRETLVELTMSRHFGAAFVDVDLGVGALAFRSQATSMNTGASESRSTVRLTGAVGYSLRAGQAWITPLAYLGRHPFPSALTRDLDSVYGAGLEVGAAAIEWAPFLRAGVARASDGDIALNSLFVSFGVRWTGFSE